MNNRKSRAKKRKYNDPEESTSYSSNDKNEDMDSDTEKKSSGSEDEEDSMSESSSSSIESHSNSSVKQIRRSKASADLFMSDSSDSGDENCEKCAICLRSITSQKVGNPEGCDHLFCSLCIIEWSKNSNVCPLDRQQFSIILVRENKNGEVAEKVPVEESQAGRNEDVVFEEIYDTVCEVCGFGDREDILLLCDLCDRGFHTSCLTPPLESVPDDNVWYCPYCESRDSSFDDSHTELLDFPSTSGSLRPRIQMVRTRLLERIRVTVNRIVENYISQHSDSESSLDISDTESLISSFTSESDSERIEDQPSTSAISSTSSVKSKKKKGQSKSRKRKVTKSRKRGSKGNRKTANRKRKTTSTKRKSTSDGKRKPKRRKTKVRTTRTKKMKVENADGTITEKIVKTRIYKKRRKQKKNNRKLKAFGTARRGLRVKSVTTPKTVKGRLALTLGMVPPRKPGQFLPDIKVRPSNSHISSIDLNRARAGIPKLHIFGPRDELQYYSSGSEQEEFLGSGSGGVATVVPQRSNISRLHDRKKAALLLESTPPLATAKPKPVTEPPTSEYVDILGSIMDSQAVWHSKNTNVKINEDGSIEVIKDKNSNAGKVTRNGTENKATDVREGKTEGLTTQAPLNPGTSSRPGGFRSNNRSSYGETRNGSQDNAFSPRNGQSSTSVNFNRFGAPARNDREGYTNYLNNMPQGPTPFCRGGPPLRFRMPPRQQLRRITIPVRNRPAWQREEEEEEEEEDEDEENNKDKEKEKDEKEKKGENIDCDPARSKKPDEEEDIDLYSDIETNAEKADNSGGEDGTANYPALGPPPEPPAFLLGLEENGEFTAVENKDKSDVYDPAEPCDSEDEMVIDENKEQSPEKKEVEQKSEASASPATKTGLEPAFQKEPSDDEDDDNDEDCPIFSIYSSATREFSQKEEEERQREIAEERRKIEELKLREEQKSCNVIEKEEVKEEEKIKHGEDAIEQNVENYGKDEKKKEKVGSRLSFDFELKGEEKESQEESSLSAKSVRESSRSRSKSIPDDKIDSRRRSLSSESEKGKQSKSPSSARDQSSSPERKYKRSKINSKTLDSDSEEEVRKLEQRSDDEKECEVRMKIRRKKDDDKFEKGEESESETVSHKVATGLEGLDVEEVSSDNGDEVEFGEKRSLSSLSLSELSNMSKRSRSPIQVKKKKKIRKKKLGKLKSGKNYEEGEIDDSEKDNRLDESLGETKKVSEEIGNENAPKLGEKKRRRSASTASTERQVLGSKENKKVTKEKSKDKDLSWKKPSKKDKNYREGKKRSKERGRSKSGERRKSKSKSKSKSPSPKKYKRKNKDRKKKTEKKKELERYDVRKIVKNKEIRKTDAFGRDIISKSRSVSRSRSRSPIRERSRNMLRRDSRSYSRSRSRSFRRGGRSPIRRRYLRSRTRSRSKSIRSIRRSYSRSRSRSRSRKSKKKLKSKDRLKLRSRSRGRKSRSVSRSRRRSPSRSRTRSPIPRIRSKKPGRARRSWSHHLSRSPSFSPRRSRSITRSPIRVRRSYTRSISTRSWSRGRSPLPRTSSLEKLTVVLTTKDKKKKKKEGKKSRKEEKKRKKTGNSKEVFASGDNVLVSVNFRNNSSAGNNIISSDIRNTRLNSLSPAPETETSRKKKKGSDYESERVTKKSKKSNPISKKVVDVALSSTCPKRAKKLTRLSEKDAEVILSRKPVAVIDLDMSPYREQTPSPVNVVVVSDSGSGDEGKEHTPQRTNIRATPGIEVEVIQENVVSQSVNVSAPSSPLENSYVPTSGPKTPPEPQIKFSINKPQQLRQIANPLGDDDDDDDEVEEEEGEQRLESLDRRIEKELNSRNEVPHKGPNTPPAPRGPSTPKTPPSPQTSPDAYDPFEPTKSRSPSPSQADKENRLSPNNDGKDDQASGSAQGDSSNAIVPSSMSENSDKVNDVILENHEDKVEKLEKVEAIPQVDCSSNVVPNQATSAPGSDIAMSESPERKIGVIISTPQVKGQSQPALKSYTPVLKQLPMVSTASAAPPSANITASSDIFSMPSPTKTSRSGPTTTTQTLQMTGIQRLQHRLGSPVNRTPNSVKSTPEKRSTPRTEANEVMSSGSFMIRNANKRNGEQPKQPRPLQDATNETIDMTMDLDDSPYSPASSEGDDLFDPPVEPPKPSQSNSKPAPSYKAVPKPTHKSPVKQLSKFDLLFGPSGPTLSPVKTASKKSNAKVSSKTAAAPKILPQKPIKKPAPSTKKNVMHKMDEDQLRILDELPSSAVELQVKDKFLKKLNRQERVVDEVKTVLKPHYARKHITKEEYKDILRRSVPKICHSRSGEINPSKIQSLIEAYVRKFRHAKKKGINAVSKPKTKKTIFS